MYSFEIALPRYVGNVPDDAGLFPLQWTDQESIGGMATARLMVTSRAWGPFGVPDGSVLLPVTDAIPLASPTDFADWDSRDAGPGCWQPYADIDDPVEGRQVSKAQGRISTLGAPAIWVTTPLAAQPDDAGRLLLGWEIDSASASVTHIEWYTVDGEHGTVVAGLPLSAGRRTSAYSVDVARLPAKPTWLYLVLSSDAGWCDAWWSGYVNRGPVQEAGVDDGGVRDAGVAGDAGGDGPRGGCGCSASGGPLLLVLIALSLARTTGRGRGRGRGSRRGHGLRSRLAITACDHGLGSWLGVTELRGPWGRGKSVGSDQLSVSVAAALEREGSNVATGSLLPFTCTASTAR